MTGVEHEVLLGSRPRVPCRDLRRGRATRSRRTAPRTSPAIVWTALGRRAAASLPGFRACARAPLLLLDEPTSELDPEAADGFLDLVGELARDAAAPSSSRSNVQPGLARTTRVLFLDSGSVVLDADRDDALDWLRSRRPAFLPRQRVLPARDRRGELVCRLEGKFAYGGPPVLEARPSISSG